jgi:hypothetical protein
MVRSRAVPVSALLPLSRVKGLSRGALVQGMLARA